MRLRLLGWPVWVDGMEKPAQTQEQLAVALREQRDILLKECDWTQMPDCSLSTEIKTDWQVWRQYMRDLPNNASTPLQYTIDIMDPPVTGKPSTWINIDDSSQPPIEQVVEKIQQMSGQ